MRGARPSPPVGVVALLLSTALTEAGGVDVAKLSGIIIGPSPTELEGRAAGLISRYFQKMLGITLPASPASPKPGRAAGVPRQHLAHPRLLRHGPAPRPRATGAERVGALLPLLGSGAIGGPSAALLPPTVRAEEGHHGLMLVERRHPRGCPAGLVASIDVRAPGHQDFDHR